MTYCFNLNSYTKIPGAESLKKKILLYLFSLTILNGCIEPTAFLGPAITISNSQEMFIRLVFHMHLTKLF